MLPVGATRSSGPGPTFTNRPGWSVRGSAPGVEAVAVEAASGPGWSVLGAASGGDSAAVMAAPHGAMAAPPVKPPVGPNVKMVNDWFESAPS